MVRGAYRTELRELDGMSGLKWDHWLTASAVVFAAAWTIGWGTAAPMGFGPWAVRLGILVAGVLPAVGLVWLWCRRHRRRFDAANRNLRALCQVDLQELWRDDNDSLLAPMPADSPWSAVVQQVRDCFRDHGRKLQDLEQSRAALEVRCRRAVHQAEQIKTILSGVPEPILVVDKYDELVLANAGAEQLFGLDGASVETRALNRLIHCQKLIDLLLGTAHHKTVGNRSEEIEIADPEGTPRWYRATAARLNDDEAARPEEQASSTGAVVVLRDIGDQKVLQKRNAEFVSSVSHEMKTPLAGIKAYVELLADGDAEDEQTREEFLSVINGQADRLQRLVENLLNLARIEAGVVKVSKAARSLNDVLEEALRVIQPSAEAKTIELVGDLSPMYLGVLADRDMLLQSAINLLSNAVKYTPSGGRVTLRSRMEEGQARFEVQDNGVGLSEEDCRRVFEKFYRVNKSKEMAAGTGLGLPLAKHIVEDVHGGRLWVESVLGKGSTFIVTLPNAGQMT